MKVRLVIIDPDQDTAVPALSPLVVEGREGIWLQGDDWGHRLPCASVEEATVADVRAALGYADDDPTVVYLTEAREKPEGMPLSEPVLTWIQDWWEETVAELRGKSAVIEKPRRRAKARVA